jgi:type IV pilus assembly protein PilQ
MGVVVLAFSLLACATPTSAPPVSPDTVKKQETTPPRQLRDIRVVEEKSSLDVLLIGSGTMAYTAFKAIDPLRLVMELSNTVSETVPSAIAVENDIIARIETRALSQKPQPMTRVEIGLNHETPYEISQDEEHIRVHFERVGLVGEEVPPPPLPAVAVEVAAPLTAVEGKATRETAREKPVTSAEATGEQPPLPPARISAINFNMLDSGKSRLAISADRPVEPELQFTGAKSLSLIFPNARLPGYLQRHIDTGQFASAVNLIDPHPVPGTTDTVAFDIQLRQMVPYHVTREGGDILVDFDRSTVAPAEPIELEEPVTLAEARSGVGEEPAGAEPETAVMQSPQRIAATTAPTEALPGMAGPKIYTGKPISLDFQDVDISNVLRLIADVTGKNIVVEPNVKGKVTLKVVEVPWDQVLDLILKINNLDSVVEGNVIRIATAKKLKDEREDRIAAIKAEKERLAEAKDLGEIGTEYLQVNYADATEIMDKLENNMSEKGTIEVDTRTNMIIYSDFPARLKTAREILARLDRPTPQVVIEARIVEASTNFSRDLGIQWGGSYTPRRISDELGGDLTIQGLLGGSNFAVDAPVGAIGSVGMSFARTAGLTLLNLDLRLSSLETTGEARVIASPRIFTLDNVEASIDQGKDIPVPVQTEDGISTEYKPATLSLKVIPHITPDEKVRLEVEAKKDEPDFGNVVNGVPAITKRSAKTELLVNSGDTIVIGGVVTQNRSWAESRVPFFSGVPGLGWLFKSRQVKDDKTELLIFLSPTIVQDHQFAQQSS